MDTPALFFYFLPPAKCAKNNLFPCMEKLLLFFAHIYVMKENHPPAACIFNVKLLIAQYGNKIARFIKLTTECKYCPKYYHRQVCVNEIKTLWQKTSGVIWTCWWLLISSKTIPAACIQFTSVIFRPIFRNMEEQLCRRLPPVTAKCTRLILTTHTQVWRKGTKNCDSLPNTRSTSRFSTQSWPKSIIRRIRNLNTKQSLENIDWT